MSVIPVTVGALEFFQADNITVPHCFTTRRGGVSEGIFDSLNLSLNRGDPAENVVENFRRIGAVLGFAPEDVVNARQIHSDTVVPVNGENRGKLTVEGASPVCDALITNTPGLALYVSTADCTPILLWDPVTGAVGAAHAGWRGTASAIAGKTVRAMCREYGCRPENIRASIGPNAGQCHFETDADVPQAMLEAFGPEVERYILRRGEKFYVNLKEINAMILRREGVTDITVSDRCTMCQPELFWSHRITRGQRGAQGGIIVCKEGTP